MTNLNRIAFIGNSLPRRCGIATFTTDLQEAVAKSSPALQTCIVAMTDHGHAYEYPPSVRFRVNDTRPEDFDDAADFLNDGDFQLACLQHEFGIFGGDAGNLIIRLLSRLAMPVVTTLHTVIAAPTPAQRAVLDRIVDFSSRVIVMAEKGRDLLQTVYRVPTDKIEVIPHGIPDFPFLEPDEAKTRFGFPGRTVILTFGLLSPNKGIEVMIDAMPAILKCRPDAVYVVLGATHPNLVRDQGEAYRESLMARVSALGITAHVVFLDQFVNQATLLGFISMCDIYVTPYLNEAQMTSGTLAYSFGLGKPVVSTPYWHARELLAEGRGSLVAFGDSNATGREIAALLTDEPRRSLMRKRAYASSRPMTWPRTAERYLATFEDVRRAHRARIAARSAAKLVARDVAADKSVGMSHFHSMCDDTGLFQHAVHNVADRSHGYCTDDNARALLVACAFNAPGTPGLSEALTSRFAAFLQNAWNPAVRRFRNFMSFDRRWLEEFGSEDSHGRALWALGECARGDRSHARRRWAISLFAQALPPAENFSSPRAWSFALLGLDAYCAAVAEDPYALRLRSLLANRLVGILTSVETRDWMWFEEELAYDNARLSQALILTGLATATPSYINLGLRSLRWLMAVQTTASGVFRPVGSHSFGAKRTRPVEFDQQPLEATATISACIAAWRAEADPAWKADAERAFAWFFGSNDLSQSLVDLETGSCLDGLHPDRPNENRGGESVVSYLLSLAEMRQLTMASDDHTSLTQRLALTA